MLDQLGKAPARGTFSVAAVAVALLVPSGAAAQKVGDVLYQSASIPVWLAVENSSGEPQVFARVVWDDADSKLRFSAELKAADLVVTVNKCAYPGEAQEHGSSSFRVKREDIACRVSDPAAVAVSHRNSPMACVAATSKDAPVRPDGEPRYLFFGCYWAQKPGGQ